MARRTFGPAVSQTDKESVSVDDTVEQVEKKEQSVNVPVEEKQEEIKPEAKSVAEEKQEEPSYYQQIADKFEISKAEFDNIADYLWYVEHNNDKMRGYGIFAVTGVFGCIFFLIAAVMGIADSLPDMFCTAKAILIIFGVSIIFFLIAFFNIRKRLRYSKLEPFKEIQYIVPCVLQQVYIRRSKQEGYDKVDIVPQGGGNVYTYDWKRSYRTRFKIKINSKRMKPGMTGYVVGYTNQFNNDNEEFVIFG